MQCLFNTVNYIIKNVIVSFFYKSTTSNIKYHLIPHVVITIDFMQLLDTPSSLSEGYRSTVFPLHSWSCQLFFPSTFISWILSIKYFLHNDIIFNKSAQDTKFTYVKICTQLIQNTKCVPKILLCVFFFFFVCFCLVFFCCFCLFVCLFFSQSLIAKPIRVHFIFTISYKTHLLLSAFWHVVQISMAASISNSYHVTTKIRLTRLWVKRRGGS